jgi:hypothetical protein
MIKRVLVRIAVVLLTCTGVLHATPFVPESDEELLEHLPTVANPLIRELRSLRQQLAREPNNLELATRLARRYIELGRAESDPRYYGYAQGSLKTWWHLAEAPAEVLVLRATIRQNRHDFDGALADLSALLSREPRHAQGWLTRAVILQVRGEYRDAQRSCLPLMNPADTLLAVTCLASVSSLSGQAGRSYELLLRTLQAAPSAPQEVRLWSLTTLAEIAVRLGKNKEAERLFREALALEQPDAYLFAAYADFLLDQNRPQAVAVLLKDEIRVDGLLLRLALSEQRLGSEQFAAHLASLRARFAASRMRGDTLHQGEEARFTLQLLNQPLEALRLAQANWAVQREPRDARILLEAAIACGDSSAARPVLEWLSETKLEDVRLKQVVERLVE